LKAACHDVDVSSLRSSTIAVSILSFALGAAGCADDPDPSDSVTPETTTTSAPTTSNAAASFELVFEKAQSSVVRIDSSGCGAAGVGSGFVVEEELVATAAHVVANALDVSVTVGETAFDGVILGLDSASDFAVVSVPGLSAPPIPIAVESPAVGSEVAAMGFPLGLPLSLAVGNVSNVAFELEPGSTSTFIQTDTAVNPGNSGGPLLNRNGEVVGVVDWQISESQGLGFAIDTQTFVPLVEAWNSSNQPEVIMECDPLDDDRPQPGGAPAPTLELPDAPWAGESVPPPSEVVSAADGWSAIREAGHGMDCALYAPTGLGEGLGMEAHPLSPVATRVGDFQFGFQDPAGFQEDVWISLWPLDATALRPYFDADPQGTEYSDGSVTRALSSHGDLGTLLIAIPGENCFYELAYGNASMVVRETMYATFRRIQGPPAP
jgi:S1-C subfamily serine protease